MNTINPKNRSNRLTAFTLHLVDEVLRTNTARQDLEDSVEVGPAKLVDNIDKMLLAIGTGVLGALWIACVAAILGKI